MKIDGGCHCGHVTFEADGNPDFVVICHCTDCQQISGSAFATLLFVKDEDIKITGETKRFEHKVDSGNTLTKDFCPTCGSQMFGGNVGRPGMTAIKAGGINEKDHIQPQFNVYVSSKAPCTILDETIPAFDKMPGIAHNKVIIIDKRKIITGSFNFTNAADTRNAENVLLIEDVNIAQIYLQNWLSRKAQSGG